MVWFLVVGIIRPELIPAKIQMSIRPLDFIRQNKFRSYLVITLIHCSSGICNLTLRLQSNLHNETKAGHSLQTSCLHQVTQFCLLFNLFRYMHVPGLLWYVHVPGLFWSITYLGMCTYSTLSTMGPGVARQILYWNRWRPKFWLGEQAVKDAEQ